MSAKNKAGTRARPSARGRGRPKGTKQTKHFDAWRSCFCATIADEFNRETGHPVEMCIQAAVNVFQRQARDKRHWDGLKASSIRRVVARIRNGEVVPIHFSGFTRRDCADELRKLSRAAEDQKAAQGIRTK